MLTSFTFIRRALALIWAASGRWTVFWIGLSLVLGILPAANVYLVKWVVDAAAHSVGAGTTWDHVLVILVPASLVLAVLVAQRLIGGLSDWVSTAQTQMVQDHIKGLIHEKSVSIDFSFFESPEYFDQFHQANSQASARTLNLLRNFGALLQSAVTFVSIMAILMHYSVWLPLLLLVSSVPALWVLLRQNRRYHAWWKEMTPDRRWAIYFDNVLTSQGVAAELRINDTGDYFASQHRLLRDRMRRDELRLTRQRVVSRLTAGFLGLCMTGLAMCWIVWKAMRGLATLGDVALFYQSINQSQTLATTLLNSMGEIHANVLFLEQVFEYLDKGNLIHDPPTPVTLPKTLRQGVRFEGVTFTYPDNERPSVQGLTLEVPAGKIVAVVGENGSGKSTLIKLLCRFYDPGQGRITVDGIDVRDLAQHELRRQISVMFQFPVRYQLTVTQNILLGDLHTEHSPEEVRAAAEGAGAHEFIMRLPKQYETLLGRSFEGACELSGGEWQRLALARAFLRRAGIVVLDEPTSFMDSWAENEWLRRFRGMVRDRTALIITHRFTTAMQADVIHVMERGAIIESGTHEQLLKLGGKYAESWRIQMRAAALKQEEAAGPRSFVRNGSE
jgi:ATP-binding cassette subfamily B protein